MNITKLEKWETIIDAAAGIIIGAIILYLLAWWLALSGNGEWMGVFGPATVAVLVAIYRLIGLLPYDSDPVIVRPIFKAKIRKELEEFGKLTIPADFAAKISGAH